MNAKDYAEHYFGNVVQFDDVFAEREEFAKVFSSGSPVLESLLLKFWERGVRTIACGNDCGWRINTFSVEQERYVQERFYKYLNAKGVSKALMNFNKRKWVPQHYGYISLQADSIKNSDEFVRNVSAEMKKYKEECFFHVKRFVVNGKRGLNFYFQLPRNKECTFTRLDNMLPEDVLKSTLPKPTAFDKYFSIFVTELERLYPITHPLSSDKRKVDIESPLGAELPRVDTLIAKAKEVQRGSSIEKKEKSRDFDRGQDL